MRNDDRSGATSRATLLLVTAIWGVNFVSARFGLDAMTPWAFRALSFGGGALLLLLLALVLRVRLRLPRSIDYLHLLVAGAFGVAGFGVLSAIALLNTTAGRTSIVVYTMPIWVALLSRFFLGEVLGAKRVAAMCLGILGLGVLMLPVLADGFSIGVLAALAAALSWAVGTVYLKWARPDAPPLAVTVWQLLAGAVVSAAALLIEGGRILHAAPGPTAWAGLAYTTLIGTAVAYLLWFQVVQRLPASVAGLGTLLVPVFGMLSGVLLLGERPTLFDAAGFALILAAGVLALGGGASNAQRASRGADPRRGSQAPGGSGGPDAPRPPGGSDAPTTPRPPAP
ncbi:DMT family transporter [Leucobacter sp. CSA1]|uniref:DMT family transporter n=1 Tax=Leucobacter chromiisoli TaxID=2796471 RepID=A0A934UTW7_9MICO|nr:DMT family transporter [Leucobacter chromiisoli]MBK0418864.1 DMT family transporter [Leucobacter chromiisoli]